MTYGTVKVNTITYKDSNNVDQTFSFSGAIQNGFTLISGASGIFTAFLSGDTITGTSVQATNITGVTIVGTTTVSGATITGTNIQATNITGVTVIGTTTVSGATITGISVQATNITGVTIVGTTTVSGATITGTNIQATNITGVTVIGTTTVSGATITGTSVQATNITGVTVIGTTTVSGATVTGTTGNFTTLNATTISGTISGYGALDTANVWTKGQRGEITTLTDAATIAIDLADSNNFKVTLGGSRQLGNPSNMISGQSGAIWITQDATGSRTLNYDSFWDFAGGSAPTLTTSGTSVDCLVYAVQSSTRITTQAILNLS
jgi:uncharacterized protein YjbI with pentapeptide repeats